MTFCSPIYIQELYRLPPKLFSKSVKDRPSTPAAPLLAFTLSQACQTSPLEIVNDFVSDIRFIPLFIAEKVDLYPSLDKSVLSLHLHYKSFITTRQYAPALSTDYILVIDRTDPPLCSVLVLKASTVHLLGSLP